MTFSSPETLSRSDSTPAGTFDLEAVAAASLTKGIGLCLSGGGYRAMLFHLGALWRLNETGVLGEIRRISSVSGGSITAGLLGLRWSDVRPADPDSPARMRRFDECVTQPIRALAGKTIDVPSVLAGALLPGSIGDYLAKAYDRHLFHGATLQQLPDDAAGQGPRFVINATNVQTGVLWRFSRPFMGDWRMGLVDAPEVPLARAVAASSAFPPFLSPVTLNLRDQTFRDPGDPTLAGESRYRQVVLTDGGVYDNLGLETVWKRYETVLISEGSGPLELIPSPPFDWLRHSVRTLLMIHTQISTLRKRQAIAAFRAGRPGAYWGAGTDIANYGLPDALPCPAPATRALALTPTRLAALRAVQQERLINWGYAVCDAALRKHVRQTLAAPGGFPYPASGV